MKRQILTICALLAAMTAGATDLFDASREAAIACRAFDGVSIQECGMMSGRSPEHSTARKAVGRFFQARAAFMVDCEGSTAFAICYDRSTWQIEAGFQSSAGVQAKLGDARQ